MNNLNKGKIFIRIGLLLIVAAFLLTAYNIWDNARAGRASQEALDALRAQIELAKENSLDTKTANEEPLYKRYPEMDMPLIKIDGEDYIGILNIPALGLELPVKGEFSFSNLRVAPCRYEGSAYMDNMIIAGHNFARHFGRLKNINIGDRVSFTDGDGNRFLYDVSEIMQVDGADVEGIKEGEWDLTLFTCTISGRSRVAVRLKRVE